MLTILLNLYLKYPISSTLKKYSIASGVQDKSICHCPFSSFSQTALENKVIKTEADNNVQISAIAALEASTNERLSKELMLDTLGMRINEEGDLVWFGQNEWIPLNKK